MGTAVSVLERNDPAYGRYQGARRQHWDRVARGSDRGRGWGAVYHRRLEELYRALIAPGQRVLELGCGGGDLLAAVEPSYGVGVDFSLAMVQRARRRHPALHFLQADVHELALAEPFDCI